MAEAAARSPQDGGVTGGLRARDLLSGEWFPRLVSRYLAYRGRRATAEERAASSPDGEALVTIAAVESALVGAASAAATTGAAWLSTQGLLGALAAAPAGALAIGGETLARTLLDLALVCDLAERAGVPFREGDRDEVVRLCGVAQGAARRGDAASLGRALVERLLGTDESVGARNAGSRRLTEGIAKNLLPVVNVATSAAASFWRTRQLGLAASRYVRLRRAAAALEGATRDPGIRHLVIEAAWVVFTADGPLEPAETSLLVHALRDLDPEARVACTARFAPDAADFLARLRALPARSRAPVWHALELLAAADGEISPADRRVLDAAAGALGRKVSDAALARRTAELGAAPTAPIARGRSRSRANGRRGSRRRAAARREEGARA